MTQPYIDLMEAAIKKHGKDIVQVASRSILSDCFILESNRLAFYYDTQDRSTHVTQMNLETGEIK